MMDGDKLMADSMQLARQMVGINESNLAHDSAIAVFQHHGGRFDAHQAPRLGACLYCPASMTRTPCDLQQLAFSCLLMQTTFQTALETVVDETLKRIGQLVRTQGGVTGDDIDRLRTSNRR
jgi:hypothetical protein